MTDIPEVASRFLEAEVSRRRCVLALDYDGTLAPFHVDRDQAVLPPRTQSLLDALAQEPATRLVIVSGRPVEELARVGAFGSGTEFWGSHGWERRAPGGQTVRFEVESPLAGVLAEEFARLTVDLEPARLERKHASIAVHWRGLDESAASSLEASVRGQWQQLAALHPLQVRGFDGGVELRVVGRDKGSVMRELLAEEAELPLLYAGDDETDEDAFRALLEYEHALTVRVVDQQEESYPGTTAAAITMTHSALLALLDRWLEATRRVR